MQGTAWGPEPRALSVVKNKENTLGLNVTERSPV